MQLLASPLSASPILPIISGISGVAAVGLGIRALIYPLDALDAFDLPVPPASNPEARHMATSLMLVYGVRDVAFGAALLATAYHGHPKAMGCIVLAGALVPLVDGVVNGWNVTGGRWKHWRFVPVSVLLGVPAMGILDGIRM
jgi:hypothetical protein